MSETYEHGDFISLRIVDLDNGEAEVAITNADARPRTFYARVSADERQAAAQALAGDEWRVVSAKSRPFDDGDPSPSRPVDEVIGWDEEVPPTIDPADVKVGDVVEVSHDGPPPWRLEGTVIDRPSSGLRLDKDLWISFKPGGELLMPRDATVRLVRRAEPDPDPEQVEALRAVWRQTLNDMGFAGQEPDEKFLQHLARQGVTVRKGGAV